MNNENEFLIIKPGLVTITLTSSQLSFLSNLCYLARSSEPIEKSEELTTSAITMGNMFYALASATYQMNGG